MKIFTLEKPLRSPIQALYLFSLQLQVSHPGRGCHPPPFFSPNKSPDFFCQTPGKLSNTIRVPPAEPSCYIGLLQKLYQLCRNCINFAGERLPFQSRTVTLALRKPSRAGLQAARLMMTFWYSLAPNRQDPSLSIQAAMLTETPITSGQAGPWGKLLSRLICLYQICFFALFPVY